MSVSLDDRQALVRYLRRYCAGRENRMKQPALAAALGWDVRYLQDVISAEAQHNPHIGTGCGTWAGVWWSVDAEDARIARRSLVGRLAPIAARVRAIDKAWPGVAQESLL
ncbi:MAG: hypothetical protein ACE149_19805 [Armatimonadota bacterium]